MPESADDTALSVLCVLAAGKGSHTLIPENPG